MRSLDGRARGIASARRAGAGSWIPPPPLQGSSSAPGGEPGSSDWEREGPSLSHQKRNQAIAFLMRGGKM